MRDLTAADLRESALLRAAQSVVLLDVALSLALLAAMDAALSLAVSCRLVDKVSRRV